MSAGPRPRDLRQRPCIVALTGGAAGLRFPLGSAPRVIGRGGAADVDIALPDLDVSRRHVELSCADDGTYQVTDLRSRNGTLLNDVPLVDTQPLAFGDMLRLGGRTLLVFTSRAPLEEHLDEAQRMQSIGRLAGGVVHNLGNALSVLRAGLGELAELFKCPDDLSGPGARELLADMVDASDRASALTSDLLRFTQRGPSTLERVDLGDVLSEVVPLVTRMASGRADIELNIDYDPALVVRADRLQIEQLVTALALNGVEAMSGGGELAVRAGRVTLSEPRSDGNRTVRAGTYVRVVVTDDGEGMSSETASQAFEPFFSTRGRNGMGLALAYSTARQHGGQLLLFSGEGEGASVEVYLPPMVADSGEHAESVDVTTTSNNRAVQPRALVVVPDASRASIEDLLRPLLIAGQYYARADDAVLAYLEDRSNIVAAIIDAGTLGRRDAIRAYRRLRSIDPALRLIVIDAPERARFAGLTDERHLRRPLERKRFARALYPR